MNFEAIKSNIKTFVEEELITLEPWILNAEWEEKLPKLNELREKTKALGLACISTVTPAVILIGLLPILDIVFFLL